MKFEESKYFNSLETNKLVMPFGNFYLCEKFFVAEVHEGVHYDLAMIKKVMDYMLDFYGEGVKLGYISNRINSYSTNPHEAWVKADEAYDIILASAIVTYNNMTFMNATLEKKFYAKSLKRCLSLDEAVEWILSIEELN